eukprot:763724-Hanusia_phi.AAC.2
MSDWLHRVRIVSHRPVPLKFLVHKSLRGHQLLSSDLSPLLPLPPPPSSPLPLPHPWPCSASLLSPSIRQPHLQHRRRGRQLVGSSSIFFALHRMLKVSSALRVEPPVPSSTPAHPQLQSRASLTSESAVLKWRAARGAGGRLQNLVGSKPPSWTCCWAGFEGWGLSCGGDIRP